MAETDGANFKVDAFLKLRQSTMPKMPTTTTSEPIADLAVPLEYKVNAKRHVRKNRQQLLSTATFCMNDDPLRMHIYGITIEDSTMAVWYFSRSHSAKSPDFDFVENPRMYIRVMLSLLFANEEELGYDQTVRRRLEGKKKKLCFVYKVGDRYFKTQRAIFEHRSLGTTGRATRVWEGIEVQSSENLRQFNGATPVVLKDVWLDSGSKTESENLRDIFVELEKIANLLKGGGSEPEAFNGMKDDAKELLRQCLKDKSWKQYFLSVVCDWQGLESKKVPAAAQPLPTLFDLPPSTTTSSSHPHPDYSQSTTSHPANLLPAAKQPPRHCCPKRHYRVVFQEVCEVLHHVRKLHDVAIALQDCVFALQLMFVAGWVHRDISTGNIYAFRFEDPGSNSIRVRGILADLEYAKPFKPNDVKGCSDPKVPGTAYFMAVEIQRQIHIYDPEPSEESSSEESSSEELSDTGEATCQGEPNTPSFVIHNFQHDLESIFWIFLWTVLARFPPTQRSPEDQNKSAGELYSIFQNTSTCPQGREAVFTRKGRLERVLKSWLDKSLKPIRKHPESLRKLLKRAYIKRGLNIDNISSYSKLHCQMQSRLARCVKRLTNTELPDLKPCSSKQDLAAVTASSAVSCPTQVAIKRERSPSNAPGGSDNQISKTARVLEATDVASSRTLHRKNSAQ